MARTLDVQAHQLRRDAFLDAAQRLIVTKGYEAMSIQDVLDALDTSRGALYHYFDSKQALLEGVVDRMAEGAMAGVRPIAADPALPALRKLERVFGAIAGFKAQQKELVLAIIDVWTSDANAIVREKVSRMTEELLRPILAGIIRQGLEEGAFATGESDAIATVIVALMVGYQHVALKQFLDRKAGAIPLSEVERTNAAFTQALARILGVKHNTLRLMDRETLHFWFG